MKLLVGAVKVPLTCKLPPLLIVKEAVVSTVKLLHETTEEIIG